MLTLPQVVDGSRSCVRDGGVIWKCQNDTFVKVLPSRSTPVVWMGGGGADGLSDLMWAGRVRYSGTQDVVCLRQGRRPGCLGETCAFCLPGGGYVLRKEDTIYRFPIAAIDLSAGVELGLVLNVPLKGPFSLPTNNMGTETLSDGTELIRSLNFHLMAVRNLLPSAMSLKSRFH